MRYRLWEKIHYFPGGPDDLFNDPVPAFFKAYVGGKSAIIHVEGAGRKRVDLSTIRHLEAVAS
jgi:hypothetical protein